MRHTRTLAVVGAVAAAALALSACGSSGSDAGEGTDPTSSTAPLLVIGSLEEPKSFDPAQANEGHLAPIYQAVYDTLLKREPDGTYSPMLASEWEVSEDGLTVTLTLRDDVTFSDGSGFDSAVAKANLEHFTAANGPMASSLRSVASIDTPDATTLVLNLSAPDPDIPRALSNAAGYMASGEALGTDAIVTEPVGSGPYILDTSRSVVGSSIVYTRNEDYWGDELPYDEVEFRILADETARLNALLSGEVDVAKLTRSANAQEAVAAGLQTEPYSTGWSGVLFFDRDGALLPELADPRVREALAIAIDREAIVEAGALGRATETTQTFGPNTQGFTDDLESAYDYDPERARELLAEAGAEDLAFTFPISTTFDPSIYDSLIQNWQDIGVTVTRHQWGPGEAIASMLGAEFPIAFMNLVQRSDWGHMQFLLAPTATWNPFDTQNDELDALITAYRDASDDERPAIAEEVNRLVVDEFWFAPVMREDQNLFWDDTVQVRVQVEQAVPSIYNYSPAS